MNRSRLLFGLLAGGVLLWWISSLWSDDEAEIRAQLDRVAELVSKQSGEKALESADRARRLSDVFLQDFEIRLDPADVTVSSGAELVRPFVGLRHQAQTIDVSFDVEELELSTPTASMRAIASVSGRVSGQRRNESFEVLVAWKKQGSSWRIESFHVTQRLEGHLF